MELMVVIAIISIVSVTIGPGLKKAYESFRIKQTVDEFVSLMKSCRSYYLIFNEFPEDTGKGELPKNLKYFTPSHFFNKTLYSNKYYKLNIIPYGGTGYDVENWLVKDDEPSAAKNTLLTMYFNTSNDREKLKKELEKIFSPTDFKLWYWSGYILGVYFQELTGISTNGYY